MKEQFVSYKLARKLFNIGFDEPVFAYYMNSESYKIDLDEGSLYLKDKFENNGSNEYSIPASTWDQAFDFLKDKTVVQGFIKKTCLLSLNKVVYIPYCYKAVTNRVKIHNGLDNIYEAKSQLLNYLIKIVQNEKTE